MLNTTYFQYVILSLHEVDISVNLLFLESITLATPGIRGAFNFVLIRMNKCIMRRLLFPSRASKVSIKFASLACASIHLLNPQRSTFQRPRGINRALASVSSALYS